MMAAAEIPLAAIGGGGGEVSQSEQHRDPRTRHLLEAPIVRTLLRMAAPNVLVMLAQASTGLVETYFVGKLGTDALAGVALVFPGVMMMQMMSAGAMGGGISSAIARALGSGRRGDADALVLHALVISAVLGVLFTGGALAGGPWLYRALGGNGGSLEAALAYSNIVFGGAILLWLFNTLASVLRGTGNMIVPAIVICAGTVILIPLSPCLIFGWGPLPRLGVAGGGTAIVLYYAIGTAVLAAYLWSGRSVVRPRLRHVRLRWPLFRDILRVGAVAALVTVQNNLTVLCTTGLVGEFGPAAIAGYGVGTRLEYLLVPLVFGLGAPLVALVGTNIGAGRGDRALRVAWTGAAIGFGISEAIGLWAALFPASWLSLFGNDPGMIDAGSAYLRTVGPFYGFFGLGLALYFSSQGAGRLLWPLCAGLLRFLIAVSGAWLMLRLTGELGYMFLTLGLGLAAYGLVNAAAVKAGAWFTRPKPVRLNGETSGRSLPAR
jgi:putative MATE family efflux protein